MSYLGAFMRGLLGTPSDYRGFRIEVQHQTVHVPNIGYDRNTGQPGRSRSRKIGRTYLIHLPDGGTKLKKTLREAHAYIDEYLGESP